MTTAKQISHVGVRFYRVDGVELVLVPLMNETASFTRSAGDGYFLVSLIGEPGAAYPVNLHAEGTYEPAYLAQKFRLDRRGYGYTPEELAAVLRIVADDIESEEQFDR